MLEIFVVNLECILPLCLFKQLVVGEKGGGGVDLSYYGTLYQWIYKY